MRHWILVPWTLVGPYGFFRGSRKMAVKAVLGTSYGPLLLADRKPGPRSSDAPQGPSHPAPGVSVTDALGMHTLWLSDENGGVGALHEGVLVLDTDALAYASTATYQSHSRVL